MKDYEILKSIDKHVVLNKVEKQQFYSALSVIHSSKNQYILEQAKPCKHLFYVESGSLRAFNLNANGKQSTIMFAIKDWWITDMNAFVNQSKALLSIESLEQSTIYAISFSGLENLYLNIPKLERFFRILFQRAYIREQLRALQSMSMNIEERYSQFIQNYPSIVEKVTQKQIASYLGVTPEFLSSVIHKKSS